MKIRLYQNGVEIGSFDEIDYYITHNCNHKILIKPRAQLQGRDDISAIVSSDTTIIIN